jgi:carboxymethylenebutenolidase
MLNRLMVFGLFIISMALTACGGSSGNENSSEAQDMADFADEKDFQEAHDEPETIAFTPKGEMIEIEVADGQKARVYALLPEQPTDKYILVFQEWWGLNDHIKQEAERLFENLEGVAILAPDMYDGKVADNQEDAGKYMQAFDKGRGEAIINGLMAYGGDDAQFATIGWCFGGGLSLQASIMAGDKGLGCVMYYGMPVQSAQELNPLQADVLGIFAEQDGWITPEVADKFQNLAKATGKNVAIHQFDAKHAFANPSNPQFDEEATEKANALALNFLKEKVTGQ